MSSEFPKLQEKFDEILSEFNKILESKIESGDIEPVKLSISCENFVPRSALAILTIPSKSKSSMSEAAKGEINSEIVTVSVLSYKKKIISYNGKKYKCSSETEENGNTLYRNCTEM